MKKSSIAGVVAVVAFAVASTAMAATFTTTLKLGSTGQSVKDLQVVLNSSADTQVAATGVGSAGNESMYFGALTKAAVIKFQEKYAADILTPVGLTKGTGLVGPSTRAKLNAMGGTTGSTTGSTTGTTVGGALTVSSPAQPANGLAIQGSSRVPFTKITLTAGSSDVVVNGITVERSGYAVNANFAGVVLLDEDGSQLDIAKTLGSTNQAVIGGTFTVKAGMSKTLTVAGNMAASLAANAGQVAALTVVAVNATGATGALPITGAMHTINGTLTIGTATAANSSYDPSAAQNKEIGTTGYKFTAMRLTAGSAEDVRLKSVRFYQAGSVASGDLSNVMIYVDGTAYPTSVSTDGKYYSASFGSGIVIAKGLGKDLWIAGDIVGSGAAGRTVRFDLQKNTDIYITGETYGQGIIATGTVNSTSLTSTPATVGYTVTVAAGSFTGVTKATSVAAQNVAVNIPSQVLGGYETDIKGESISVQSQVFTIASSSGSGTGLLTSVSLYDANGAVVAGPVDAVYASATTQTVTFTDTVTYPVGKKVYTLKGKVAAAIGNGTVYTASTNPSTGWTNITGQTTGNTITISTGSFNMNPVTVKAAALAVAQSTSPAAQNIVGGGSVTFANFQLDASASGEDVRLSSIALTDTVGGGAAVTNLTGCQLFDGATALNTGSNVVNPSAAAATFTFDSSLTVAKNTVKTLTLKCNVASTVSNGYTYTWNTTNTQIAAIAVTGVNSSTSVTATGASTTGATQTVAAGALAVSLAPSSPALSLAQAGTTGKTISVLRFIAANEPVTLEKIGLAIGTATTSVGLTQVTVWDGATQLGTATFTGNSTTAIATLSTPVVLPKDAAKDLTIKADFAQIGTGFAAIQGATIKVDLDGTLTNTQGTGNNSGTTINPTGSTASAGVQVYKSIPTFATDTLSATGVADGKLARFKVTAGSNGDVSLAQITLTSTFSGLTSLTNANIYVYSDAAYSQAASLGTGFTNANAMANADVTPITSGAAFKVAAPAPLIIPAGETRYFEVRGIVTPSGTTYSVSTVVSGDASGVALAASAGLLAGNNVVWSANKLTTSAFVDADWANGVAISGLPSTGLTTTRGN